MIGKEKEPENRTTFTRDRFYALLKGDDDAVMMIHHPVGRSVGRSVGQPNKQTIYHALCYEKHPNPQLPERTKNTNIYLGALFKPRRGNGVGPLRVFQLLKTYIIYNTLLLRPWFLPVS